MHGVWKHYKGNLYKVVGLAKNTKTMERSVVYEGILKKNNQKGMWITPMSDFFKIIDKDGEQIQRFIRIDFDEKTQN